MIKYGSASDAGLRSSRYPYSFNATDVGILILTLRSAIPYENIFLSLVSHVPFNRLVLSP